MNDQSESPKLWAIKGEKVTCINGHDICEIAHDIPVGAPRAGTDFTDWVQPEPDHSTSVAEIRCNKCRGVWIRGSTSDGYQFHFGSPPGEWR